MTDKTRKKILDVALKEFAENGYKAATTRVIAQKSGFTEATIFRKFKNKKNLFSSVLNEYNEKMMKDFHSLFKEKEFKDSKEFLEALIRNLLSFCDNNLDFVKITINESSRISGNFLDEIVDHLSIYAEKNIQNDKIDYKVFIFSILSFVYLFHVDYGHTFKDNDEAVENFINNFTLCIQ